MIFIAEFVCVQKQPIEMLCKKKLFLEISQISLENSYLTPVFESLFNKVPDLKACNFIKVGLQYMCFTVKFAKFSE